MRILGIFILTALFVSAPAQALLCAVVPGQTCNRLNLWPDRVIYLNCAMMVNSSPGEPRGGCSWDHCYGSHSQGGPSPPNGAAYCNASQAGFQGIQVGFYSVSSNDYDSDGEIDADFRKIGGPPPSTVPLCDITDISTGSPNINCVYDCVGGGGPLPDVNLTIPAGTSCNSASNRTTAAAMGACTVSITPLSCTFGPGPSPTPSSSPSPAPSPPPPPTWADHQCGTAGMSPSAIPVTAPSGTPFGQLANPVAACCSLGWAQGGVPTASSYKMDCIDAGPTADFLAFYNYAGGDIDRDAGVSRPNRFFATVAGGTPLSGFYNSKGARCVYRDPISGVAKNLTIDEQYALFDHAIAHRKIPTTASVARLDADCHNLVLLGLERRCPGVNPANGRIWRAEPPFSTVPRCTAAATMRTHFYVMDLSDTAVKRRGKFHAVSSLLNDPQADVFSTENVPYQKLIPQVFTLPPGTCPDGFRPPNPAGECEIDPI